MIGILLALVLTQPVQCRVTALSDPVVVQCGADTLAIPVSKWPEQWGGPRAATFWMSMDGWPLTEAQAQAIIHARSRAEQRRWMRPLYR